MNATALFIATFLACLVEAVEATTIVLAAGTARNWRSAVEGTLAALLVLAAAVAVAGPAITLLPISVLRIVVGGLLLVFGLQWIRKAVLRASGRKSLHDEVAIYERELQAARTQGGGVSRGRDGYAFTLSFKGVLLEGLEVVFIVLTFGTNAQDLPLAAIAAAAAVLVVVGLGFAVRGPLSRVPENTLKFVVGIMLTAFGIFWSAEGAGAIWPGSDAALLVIAPAVAIASLLLVLALRLPSRPPKTAAPAPGPRVPLVSVAATQAEGAAPQGSAVQVLTSTADGDEIEAVPAADRRGALSALRSFGGFWIDFLFGEDWTVPVLVAVGIAVTALLGSTVAASWAVMPIAVLIALAFSTARALR
ncbi:MAG: hypothetical protein QOE37_909 [Microbacteriaceae bacterium]|nr:hypothetical protein [Microbacteriaceae bacterium]